MGLGEGGHRFRRLEAFRHHALDQDVGALVAERQADLCPSARLQQGRQQAAQRRHQGEQLGPQDMAFA